ncbi:MAG: serpin family protein [Flavobacteriales bacterium]|nr:serpin family protein [Flavobacteriales bacterium]
MNKTIITIIAFIVSFGAFSQNNKFAFDFYNQIKDGDNILFSPVSIKAAFAMAYEGANSETQKEFETVFDFKENNEHYFNELEQLKDLMLISNSVWIQKGFKVLESYKDKLKKHFKTDAYTTDFAGDSEESAKKMNDWIADKTNKMIQKMVSASQVTDFKLALINAVYFKQDWSKKFDKELTKKEKFYNADKSTVKVDMMYAREHYRAYEGNAEKVVEIPYKDDRTSLLIILPNKMSSYKLKEEGYMSFLRSMYRREVILHLPKFTFETPTFELKPDLEKMGLNLAFSNGADFSGMREERDLKIGTALHKAKIIVNEEGTEAAAATVIGIKTTSAISITPPEPLEVRVDKPFFYFIKDNLTNNILFMGRMNKMEEAE